MLIESYFFLMHSLNFQINIQYFSSNSRKKKKKSSHTCIFYMKAHESG